MLACGRRKKLVVAGNPSVGQRRRQVLFNSEHLATKFQSARDDMTWTSLPISETPHRIHLISISCWRVNSPFSIIVSQVENANDLQKLNDSLNFRVNKLIRMRYPDYEKRFSEFYEEGLVIAAKDSAKGLWQRAIVISGKGSRMIKAYYVDTGLASLQLSMKEVFPMPRKFVTQLPFQAVAISLSHVYPINEGILKLNGNIVKNVWSNIANGFTTEQMQEPDLCAVLTSTKNSSFSLGSHGAKLWSTYDGFIFNPNLCEIGENLVNEGLADFDIWGLLQWDSILACLILQTRGLREGSDLEEVDLASVTNFQEEEKNKRTEHKRESWWRKKKCNIL